ncbi:hypothetical protein GCM10009825_18470 [Arthrobacter humicola]|uniref:Uncharacterized protein n=1 Tax=Arthrobacter humicola TaxID=409291 RepID=A0ABN2Z044_9MICC
MQSRRGIRLHGHLEAVDDGDLVFSDDLPERLALVEAAFYQRMKPMFDSYIAATGMSAPEPEPPRKDDWLPSEPARLNLEAANVTSVGRDAEYIAQHIAENKAHHIAAR